MSTSTLKQSVRLYEYVNNKYTKPRSYSKPLFRANTFTLTEVGQRVLTKLTAPAKPLFSRYLWK